ncbi:MULTISPECIES: hypothetical protein [Sorangium]|uniref:hypothetical protein n=1 Tax=Sorangium TaxID=39643 RepID=UPI001A92B25A|nr:MULTISPECIES: hypothetical protein [Sorangium]
MQLEAWVQAQGGLRAAARRLGVGHGTVRRWVVGEHLPDDRAGLEQSTGVPAAAWDQAEQPPARQAAPRPAPAATRPSPPAALPRRAAKAPAAPVAPPSPPAPSAEVEPPPPAPATLPELQARARQIPGEMQQLRGRIASGAVAMSQGEILARMLEREARALASAITAAGTATVEEVEQLRALVLDVTRGCDGCRARVTSALRGGAPA